MPIFSTTIPLVSFEQLKKFIRAQPNNKPINMKQPTYGYMETPTTGDILVHYGCAVLGFKQSFGCFLHYWIENTAVIAYGDNEIKEYIRDALKRKITTYKEAKALLKDHELLSRRNKKSGKGKSGGIPEVHPVAA